MLMDGLKNLDHESRTLDRLNSKKETKNVEEHDLDFMFWLIYHRRFVLKIVYFSL